MSWRTFINHLPVIILILVAMNQILVLQPIYKFSRWKGGGFGVYCRPYEYFLLTFVQIGGNTYIVNMKGRPSKNWVNEREDDLKKLTNRYLNNSYLISHRFSEPVIAGMVSVCSKAEEDFFNSMKQESQNIPKEYVSKELIEKVTIQLWRFELSDYNTTRSEILKTINEARKY